MPKTNQTGTFYATAAVAGMLAIAGPAAAQNRSNFRSKTAAEPKATLAGAAAPSLENLKQRVATYYGDIRSNDKAAALQLVAPQSRSDFFNMHYEGLVAVRITGVHPTKDGSAATVDMMRTVHPSSFQQMLDLPGKDTWKAVGGKWCIVLPDAKVQMTPFGKLHFGQQPANAAQVEEQMKQARKDVDPEQAVNALRKLAAQQANKVAAAQKRTGQKPAGGKAVPASPSSKQKPKTPSP